MNKRANEITLNDEQFEQLKTMYITTIVESMDVAELEQYVLNDMEDFRQYVANDMKDFLYNCSESEVINELLIKVKYTLDEQFYNKFVKQNKEKLLTKCV